MEVILILKGLLDKKKPKEINYKLSQFFFTPLFMSWKGKVIFLQKYEDIFTKRKFKFSKKALKYIIPKINKAWRGAIRDVRLELEAVKSQFNKIKYLILMNPENMKQYHIKKLRKYLK